MTGRAPYLAAAAAVAEEAGVDPERGLPEADADTRRATHGPNELRAVPPVPRWRRILAQFQDPLVSLLLVAIVISVAVWVVEGAHGAPVDAIVIAAILVLNAVLGYVEEAKAADAVAALASLTAASSTVLRDGSPAVVPTTALVPGDVLVLAEGDTIGADARLLTATGLKLQEAALTGESEATVKDPAPLAGEAVLGDRTNMVYKGTAVVEGVGRAVVTATGMATEMGAIAGMLERTEAAPSPLESEIARVSKTLGALVIGIALVVMGALVLEYGVHDAEEVTTILLLGVSLAVAAVPEGLPAILSLVLAIGVRAMAARHAVMKELHAVETLGSASVVCSDKTGTLTRNEMTLRAIATASGRVELTGTGFDPHGDATIDADDEERALTEARVTLIGGVVANNAGLRHTDDGWEIHGDPTEAAFLVAQHKLSEVPVRVARYQRLGEIPFSSERKLMSVLSHHEGRDEDRLYTKGAPDVLLGRCVAERVGDEVVALDEAARARVTTAIEELSAEGYRTLGVAYRVGRPTRPITPEVDDERDLVLVGIVGIIDPLREEARDAVAEAHRAGVRVVMITGDHPATAARIAADLGITARDGRAVTGAELEAMDDDALADAVEDREVYARVAPEHKLRIVGALQSHGHVVAMTGDGVNDAPALKAADIGIAMGITGTEVSKGAARMILGDDNFATIVSAIREGRVIFDNISKFLRYLLSSNMGEVATVFFGIVAAGVFGLRGGSGEELVVPLLATQILWINLVTDSAPALAMGVDPEIDDVMARPPRAPDERILGRQTWVRIVWVGLLMGLATLLTMDLNLPGGLIEGHGTMELARTAGFTTLVLAQLFNALNSRSFLGSAFHRMWVNPWLWASIVLGIVLQVAVVHLPGLQHAFGTVPLSLTQWGVCVAMASASLWASELVKLARRRRGAPTPAWAR